MLVTVVRHAESMGNAGLSHEADPLLSPKGIRQAELAAQRLATEGVTHIWTSPFRRAIHTASFLSSATSLRVLLEPDMVEHYIYDDLKEYHGRTGVELREEFDFVIVPDGFDDGTWTPTWGETWDDLLERTSRVAERAVELGQQASNDFHVAVFAHGASTKALVSNLLGIEIASDAGYVNAGMSRARLDGSLPGTEVFMNDARHLSSLREDTGT